jgi:hypothetical protein
MLEKILKTGCICKNVPALQRIRRNKVVSVQYQLFHLISDAKGFVTSINSLPVLTNNKVCTKIKIFLNYKMIRISVCASSACETIARLQGFYESPFLIF